MQLANFSLAFPFQFFARICPSNIAFHRSPAQSFSGSAFGSRCGQLRRTTSALSSEMPSTWPATRCSSSSALSCWSFRLSDAAAHNKKTPVFCSVWVFKRRDFIIHLFLVMPRDLNEIHGRFLAACLWNVAVMSLIIFEIRWNFLNYDKVILETRVILKQWSWFSSSKFLALKVRIYYIMAISVTSIQ